MTVRIEDHESTDVKATVATNHDGLIRPAPTPFDADTAVTAEAISVSYTHLTQPTKSIV